MRRDRRRPRRSAQPHRARQPDRRDHQRHRGARPGRDRPARRQAGDGRQVGAVQEVRRHRLLRHRDRGARPRQAGRHHLRARADVRRHQPRGHQGARVLHRREEMPRAHAHPGVPRRPARHGDHRRRGDPQRPARGRQGTARRQARLLRRGRGGAGVPRPARVARHQAREHLGVGHRRRRLHRPHRADGRPQVDLRAADRRIASWRRSSTAPTSSSAFPPAAC